MSTFKFAVLPGDGIGPEVMDAALEVLDAACKKHGHSLDYKICAVGGAGIDQFGKALPDSTVETCKNSDAILFGASAYPQNLQALCEHQTRTALPAAYRRLAA